MLLAYKAVDGTAPAYLQALTTHTPAQGLRSATSAGRPVPPVSLGLYATGQMYMVERPGVPG